jgi:hypothetical protein
MRSLTVPLSGIQIDKLRGNLQKFLDDPDCANFINAMLKSLPENRAKTTKYGGSLMDNLERFDRSGGFWTGPLKSLGLTNPMTLTIRFRGDITASFFGKFNEQLSATTILVHELIHGFTNAPSGGMYQHTDMALAASDAATSLGFGALFEVPTTKKYGTGEDYDHALSEYYGKTLNYACRKAKL